MTFKHTIRTRYSETAQDGIIHHSAYVIYLEVARIEFFKTIGIDINALEKQKRYCPVIDLSVKHLKPLYSLEDILIEVSVGEFSKVRFSLNYRIFRNDACVATATVSHCFLNAAFKPMPLPEAVLAQFRKLSQGT